MKYFSIFKPYILIKKIFFKDLCPLIKDISSSGADSFYKGSASVERFVDLGWFKRSLFSPSSQAWQFHYVSGERPGQAIVSLPIS